MIARNKTLPNPLPVGVELVQELKLFAVDMVTGQRGRAQQRIDVEPQSVVVSHEHMVAVSDQ